MPATGKRLAKDSLAADRKQKSRRLTGILYSEAGHCVHPLLDLKSYFVVTGPGEATRRDVKVDRVELSPLEKTHVREALALVLQAIRAFDGRSIPDSLDKNLDLLWDFRTVPLSVNEYAAFAFAILNYYPTKIAFDNVSYDWIPDGEDGGVFSVRKKCGFQSQVTRDLSSWITDAMCDNILLMSLVDSVDFEPQIRVPVLNGISEGRRTPCRCFHFTPKQGVVARPFKCIQDFVLEVGMGEKNRFLPELARSYIARGTLCVMTVSIARQGAHDVSWTYSLYRRGKARYFEGRVTSYEVLCDVEDSQIKSDKTGEREAHGGLTLYDFVPHCILKDIGVHDQNDKRALVVSGDDLNNWISGDPCQFLCIPPLDTATSLSGHLTELEQFL